MHDPAVLIMATGDRRPEAATALARRLSPRHLLVVRDEPHDPSKGLFGFEGPVLFLPATDTLPSLPAVQTLLEIHDAEANRVTLLTASGPAGGKFGGEGVPVTRDARGRIRAIDAPASRRAGEQGPLELTTGIAAWSCGALFGKGGATGATGLTRFTLDAAIGVLYERGERVGALHLSVAEAGVPDEEWARWEPGPESGILKVGEHVCLAVDRPGFNSGQLIIFPKRAVRCWPSLSEEELAELAEFVRQGETLLRKVYRFDALNLGWNSGSGERVGLRMIPRWAGDLSFLPLVSGLKPVPESPEQAYLRLSEELR